MSRYEPLTRFLEGRAEDQIPLTFRQIESILSRSLPPSARQHQPWWANTSTHSHADAWMRVGWKTQKVDLASERVVFAKSFANAASRSSMTSASGPEEIVLRRDLLSQPAKRLVQLRMAEDGCSESQAIASLLNAAAVERRRRLLERFPLTGERSTVDSTDLIREDRDAR